MTAKSKSTKTEMRPAIAVIGPKEGFRRCGIRFGPEPVYLTEDDITDKQAERLANEPRLMVSEVEIPVEEDAGANQ